ncbi:MAG: RNA polymerase sigma factor [Flavobacteriales bacterium]|nr:RNA polymerase sigma factor [Flavobacteriales bacterium]
MKTIFKQSDEQIISGCVKGNPKSQRLLYDRYADKMFGLCMRYAKDHDSAQDILQDGFIRVFDKIKLYRGEGSFEGWMRRLFVNVAIRSIQKDKQLYLVSAVEEVHDEGENTTEINYNSDELLNIIQKLPNGYRLVFNLYAIEGYSHKEIAEQLGISEGTSKSQLARARKALQEILSNYSENLRYDGRSGKY